MRDLRSDLAQLWRTLLRVPRHSGARAILFVGAQSGDGASSVAASMALYAAAHASKTAWLIDLDVEAQTQFDAFKRGFAQDAGAPGRAFDATLRQAPPFETIPAEDLETEPGKPRRKLLAVHPIAQTRLLVTRFRRELLEPGQKVILRHSPAWWSVLRRSTNWILLDAPPLSSSDAALIFAPLVDGVVLVVDADRTPAAEVDALQSEITATGGRILGAVLNRVGADARTADRWAR